MVLGVEHLIVPDAGIIEQFRHQFRLLDGHRAHKDRPPFLLNALNFTDHVLELAALGREDEVRQVLANQRQVCRNLHHVEAIGAVEFRRFRGGGTGHARQLPVEAKVVLVTDRGDGLRFETQGHPFLRLQRLVQAVRVAAPFHHAAGELIDNEHLAVAHHVVLVAFEEVVRLDGLFEHVHHADVLVGEQVVHAEHPLRLLHALVGDEHLIPLLLRFVVGVAAKAAHHVVNLDIEVGALLRAARDNQRCPGLVDQDGVHLVDNRVIQLPLHPLLRPQRHVVAQIVEPKLVVGAVSDVGAIAHLPLECLHIVLNQADRQPEKLIDAAHPLAVAAREVVVDGNHVHAASRKGVQVHRHGRHQGLALTGDHLGYLTVVQHDTADDLHVERAQTRGPFRRLAHDRERLGQQVVERFALPETRFEQARLGAQLFVRHGAHPRTVRANGLKQRHQTLDLALGACAEKGCQNSR